jgi:hypothetical protein
MARSTSRPQRLLAERAIRTGLGDVEVKQPWVYDRRPPGQREHFTSAILRPYLKRTRSFDDLTVKTNGCGGRVACLTMVFELIESASRSWRSLNRSARLHAVISGARFVDGIEVKDAA